MVSGGSGACRSLGRREAMPNPVSQTWPLAPFTRIWAGLRSLWTRPRWWSLAKRGDDADGEVQEASDFRRRAKQLVERLAAGILEHQRGLTLVADERQRPHRPAFVQFVPQSVLVGQAIERGRAPDVPRRAVRPARRCDCRRHAGTSLGRRRTRRPPIRRGGCCLRRFGAGPYTEPLRTSRRPRQASLHHLASMTKCQNFPGLRSR